MMYRVNVLMSTCNGERYLRQQVESIMNQEGVDILLTVRDDGSSDGTVNLLRELSREYGNRIKVYSGGNIGYKRSFMKLLEHAAEAEFYAFSDQDDVWFEQKTKMAIKLIEDRSSKDDICLYASGDIITDENLNIIGKHEVSDMPVNIQSFFSRARLAGCTYVFTAPCMELAKRFTGIKYMKREVPDHDFVLGSIALGCGKMILDDNAYIYHRRTNVSATSGGNGIMQRIKVEANLVFGRRGVQSRMAAELLDRCDGELLKEAKSFLTEVADYKTAKKGKLRLLNNKMMKSGVPIGDIETKVKIILGNY